jgi:hypothetical protein
VPALIDQAKAAYAAGDHQTALDALQKATAAIQAKVAVSLEGFIPEPPGGWKAEPVESQSASYTAGTETIRVNTIKRTYTREADACEVTVTITNMPEQVKAMREVMRTYKDPQLQALAKLDPNQTLRIEEKDGWTLLTKVEKDGKAEITAATDSLLLQLECSLADEKPLREILGKLNLKGLAAAGQPRGVAKP